MGDGGEREGCQPALGPHVGMQEMESREEGPERLQGATVGTGWQRSIFSICGCTMC